MRNPGAGYRVAEMHLAARDKVPSIYVYADLDRLTNWFFRINGISENDGKQIIADWRKWGPSVNEFRINPTLFQ